MKRNTGWETKKYEVQIQYNGQEKEIQLFLIQKMKNYPTCLYFSQLSKEMVSQDVMSGICRYRTLTIQSHLTSITTTLEKIKQLKLRPLRLSGQKEKKVEGKSGNLKLGIRYWRTRFAGIEINAVLDPHNSLVFINMLQKQSDVKVAQTTITLQQLKGKKSPLKGKLPEEQLLLTLFKNVSQCTLFQVLWEEKLLTTNHQLLKPLPLAHTLVIKGKQAELPSKKIQLFKHIFLTEVITHLIINQFGRLLDKKYTYREGNQGIEYIDEQLEKLRNYGHRFSSFGNHSFKPKKRKKKKKKKKYMLEDILEDSEDDYQDDDEDHEDKDIVGIPDQDSSDSEGKNETKLKEINTQRKPNQEKKQTKLKKMKEKMKRKDGICNFTLISGKDKSKINQVRYCLHQMSQETDKTQGVIDFLRLVFALYSKQQLVRDAKENMKLKHKITDFMEKFKVKRQIRSCFEEYTRESFFHKVLNTGLRIFQHPYELAYLRVPFSHIFWSIKWIYQHHKKNTFSAKNKQICEDKPLCVYRGFEIRQKEIKRMRKMVGGFVEMQGFLSTSLSESFANAFITNAKMVISVPLAGLRGMNDNGFAYISKYSEHQSEKEVLINAFNVFKILCIQTAFDEGTDMVIHTVYLQYGMKQVEEKVKKGERLLDAEYVHIKNGQELKKAKIALETNKDEISKKMYEKLVLLIPKAEEQLKRRLKQLQQWKQQDFLQALQKLNEWEKQLIINQKHQQHKLSWMINYGQLLLISGQFRRAAIYCRRMVKQVEFVKAAEGCHWRNCFCLILKQSIHRRILVSACMMLGKPEESLLQAQKVLDLYVSTNMKQSNERYYSLLYDMYLVCGDMNDERKQNKYKEQLMGILEQHKLYDAPQYISITEQMKQISKEKQSTDQEEEKKAAKRKQTIKEANKQLKNISLYRQGKYSSQYLVKLAILIDKLHRWGEQLPVVKKGVIYLNIRKHIPYAQSRVRTCFVFKCLLKLCSQRKLKQLFYFTCSQLASFMKSNIYREKELNVIVLCLQESLIRQWYRAARPVGIKLIGCKHKWGRKVELERTVMFYAYMVLMLSVSKEAVINKFLSWDTFQQECEQNGKNLNRLLSQIRWYNNKYKHSNKSIYAEREKEYHEHTLLQFTTQLLTFHQTPWRSIKWEERRLQLMGWQHPLHPHYIHIQYVRHGQQKYMEKGQANMMIDCFQQQKNMLYGRLNADDANTYLRKLKSISKLHLSDRELKRMGDLLQFWAYATQQLEAVQMVDMGINLQALIQNQQHLEQNRKQLFLRGIQERKEVLKWNRKQITSATSEVKRFRVIYARLAHYFLFTSNRRLRAQRQKMV